MKDIAWFKKKKGGVASIYATNLTLNAKASLPFKEATYVQVGLGGAKLAIKAVKPSEVEKAKKEGIEVYKIGVHSSYARISSTELIKQIEQITGFKFEEKARKFIASYDESEKLLLIDLLGEIIDD